MPSTETHSLEETNLIPVGGDRECLIPQERRAFVLSVRKHTDLVAKYGLNSPEAIEHLRSIKDDGTLAVINNYRSGARAIFSDP